MSLQVAIKGRFHQVSKHQNKAGRPATVIKPILDTPERVAQAIMQKPPKDKEGGTGWAYIKDAKAT